MDAALQARIETSVGARRAGVAYRALARLGIAITVVTAVVSIIVQRRGGEQALERQRAALLADLKERRAFFGPNAQGAMGHIEGALLRFAASYDGDVPLHDLGRARPTVYVRGTLDGIGSGAAIKKTASASYKDAFVACWIDPPRARVEKNILSKVRAAYGAGVATPNVHRLGDAYTSLALLDRAWEGRVRASHNEHEIIVLQNELHRAPFDDAKQALDAELLLAVIDEPGDPSSPAELDGERAHTMRVLVFDLKSDQVLVRVRRPVDPEAWSQSARAEWASGLDACALAYDLVSG